MRQGAYQLTDLKVVDEFERARWRHAAEAIAAVLVTPGALASHSTAAVLRRLPLLFLPDRPCVSVVPEHTGQIRRVHTHRCRQIPHSLPVGDVACLALPRTAVDLAREHGVAAGVVAMDAALQRQWTDVRSLNSELQICRGWPGSRAGTEAVAMADGLSESPLESLSRVKLARAGLPPPELQVCIGNEWGGFVARVDFYWDEFGVVGEADGAVKYNGNDPEPLFKEKRRHEALANLGLKILRWGAREMRNFRDVEEQLRRAYARGTSRGIERRWTVLPRFAPVSAAAQPIW